MRAGFAQRIGELQATPCARFALLDELGDRAFASLEEARDNLLYDSEQAAPD
jgi:hypothetical protein